jgi:hypothetical protein
MFDFQIDEFGEELDLEKRISDQRWSMVEDQQILEKFSRVQNKSSKVDG